MDIYRLRSRKEVPKYIKEQKENETSNVVKISRKKLYEYYKCDYCGDEIRLDKKQHERSGGIVTFPHTLTKKGKITMALCNKCLRKTIEKIIEN